jgi:hypothetical protein
MCPVSRAYRTVNCVLQCIFRCCRQSYMAQVALCLSTPRGMRIWSTGPIRTTKGTPASALRWREKLSMRKRDPRARGCHRKRTEMARVAAGFAYFGPRTCDGSITIVIEVGRALNPGFPFSPLNVHFCVQSQAQRC